MIWKPESNSVVVGVEKQKYVDVTARAYDAIPVARVTNRERGEAQVARGFRGKVEPTLTRDRIVGLGEHIVQEYVHIVTLGHVYLPPKRA